MKIKASVKCYHVEPASDHKVTLLSAKWQTGLPVRQQTGQGGFRGTELLLFARAKWTFGEIKLSVH
jgi:hypothetical protein